MAGRNTAVTRLLVLLTIVHRDLSLPPKITALVRRSIDTKTNSTGSATFNDQPPLGSALRSMTKQIAVQVRLRHADRVTAAFNQKLPTVDIPGDRADILSLEFPVEWPATPAYVRRVSTVVDNYFPARDIKDHVCQSEFAEVTLSSGGMNDKKSLPVWRAEVTTNGLVKRSLVFAKASDLHSDAGQVTGMVLHK
jgi:hypothetical protein